jgi:hypothetical protein
MQFVSNLDQQSINAGDDDPGLLEDEEGESSPFDNLLRLT